MMGVMSTQFKIQDIRLLNLHYSLHAGDNSSLIEPVAEDATPVPVELLCNSNYDEQEHLLRVRLSATIKGPKPVFHLDAEIGGVFQLDSDPDKAALDRLRHINCPAILYPYLREVISEITKRGGFDPVYLAPMNFVETYRSSRINQGEKAVDGGTC